MSRFLGRIDRRSPSRLRSSASPQLESTAALVSPRPLAQDLDPAWLGAPTFQAESIEETAARGARGSGQPLPHLDTLQAVFPGHRLSELRIHVDSPANRAAQALGATAYTRGNDLVFGSGTPDLATLAHETTHALQQQAGLRPEGGIGRPTDRLEEQAHAASQAAAAGQSAAPIVRNLLPHSPGARSRGTSAVQFLTEKELQALNSKYGEELVNRAIRTLRFIDTRRNKPERTLEQIDAAEIEKAIIAIIDQSKSPESKAVSPRAKTQEASSVPVPSTPLPSAESSSSPAKQSNDPKPDLSRYNNVTWGSGQGFENTLRLGKLDANVMNCYEFVMVFAIDHGFVSFDEILNMGDHDKKYLPDVFINILTQKAELTDLKEAKDFEFGDILFFVGPRAHTFISLGNGLAAECRAIPDQNHVHQMNIAEIHKDHHNPRFIINILADKIHAEMAVFHKSSYNTPGRFFKQYSYDSKTLKQEQAADENWDDANDQFSELKENENISMDDINNIINDVATGWNQKFLRKVVDLPLFRVRKADWIQAVKRAQPRGSHP
ncbi:MAG: DUF4157 domain-containing protein [Myxococcales bacterium]|nr:DUF4157 domain-containing protein [Myxococcales bacterium]